VAIVAYVRPRLRSIKKLPEMNQAKA